MTSPEPSHDLTQQIALFRYSLLGDLVHQEPGAPGLYDKLRERSTRSYHIPGSNRTHVAVETLRGWLKDFRRGGFDALKPRPRADNGLSRTIPQSIADRICTIKEDDRSLTVDKVIAEVRTQLALPPETSLPRSTVHRLLQKHGLMEKPPGDPSNNDRRRFTFEKAGALWMSDVMHGPSVTTDDKRKRKTYLIAFIDDATRMIPFAEFALHEHTTAYLASLKQAIARRGIPERLYVDNGSAFRSQQLSLVCAKLGTTLIHARPYQPSGKGKMERWFRTVRLMFLPNLPPHALDSLESLNRALWAFVEGEYHQRPHKGLDDNTPADMWAQRSADVRMPSHHLDVDDLFLFEEKRKVTRDRVVSLRGIPYEVDAALVGQTVVLRFDPSKPNASVQIHHNGKFVENAKIVNAYANCFVKRDHGTKLLHAEQEPRFPAGLPLRNLNNDKE